MKKQFRLYKRAGWFYSVESATGKQKALKTKDRTEAEAMVAALNSPQESIALNRELGRIYLQPPAAAVAG